MTEHLLMALDVHADEEEPVVVRVDAGQITLVLDDGRELVLDADDLREAIALPKRRAAA